MAYNMQINKEVDETIDYLFEEYSKQDIKDTLSKFDTLEDIFTDYCIDEENDYWKGLK
jgi:hypothetical protein